MGDLPPIVDSPKAGSSKQTTTATSSTFTPEMQDRQARGKNPYNDSSSDSDWGTGQGGGNSEGGSSSAAKVGPQRVGAPKSKERFAIRDRRRMAAQILNSTELLMMAAVRDDESIPATRLKYTRILCGLDDGSAQTGAARPLTADNQRKRINIDLGYRSVSGNARE